MICIWHSIDKHAMIKCARKNVNRSHPARFEEEENEQQTNQKNKRRRNESQKKNETNDNFLFPQ